MQIAFYWTRIDEKFIYSLATRIENDINHNVTYRPGKPKCVLSNSKTWYLRSLISHVIITDSKETRLLSSSKSQTQLNTRLQLSNVHTYSCIMNCSSSPLSHNLRPATPMPNRQKRTTRPTLMLAILEPRSEIGNTA